MCRIHLDVVPHASNISTYVGDHCLTQVQSQIELHCQLQSLQALCDLKQ